LWSVALGGEGVSPADLALARRGPPSSSPSIRVGRGAHRLLQTPVPAMRWALPWPTRHWPPCCLRLSPSSYYGAGGAPYPLLRPSVRAAPSLAAHRNGQPGSSRAVLWEQPDRHVAVL